MWGGRIAGTHDAAIAWRQFSSGLHVEGVRFGPVSRSTYDKAGSGEHIYIGYGNDVNRPGYNVVIRGITSVGATNEAIDLKILSSGVLVEYCLIEDALVHFQGSVVVAINTDKPVDYDPHFALRRCVLRHIGARPAREAVGRGDRNGIVAGKGGVTIVTCLIYGTEGNPIDGYDESSEINEVILKDCVILATNPGTKSVVEHRRSNPNRSLRWRRSRIDFLIRSKVRSALMPFPRM